MIVKKILESLPENNQFERIWILAKTDFKIRYYGTFLGLVWALINPLSRLSVYYIVFSLVIEHNIPNYGLHIFSGLVIWMFFLEGTKKGLNMIKSKRYLLENVDFNKLDIYISAVLSSLMGLLFNIFVYLIASSFSGIFPNWNLLFLPLMILNVCILVLAISIILSVIHIFIRDVSQIWDMLLLALFWLNPIFFARTSRVFDKFPALLYANPVAGIIINTRNVLLYGKPPDWGVLLFDYAYALALLGIGLIVFKKLFHKAAEKF